MKIAIAQINPCVGDLEGNQRKIIAGIQRARNAGAAIAVFPELAVTGYPPEDLLLKPHFVSGNLKTLDRITKACRDVIALVGFVDRDKYGIYNACAIIQDTRIKAVYRKMCLPNYGVFDEKRYFQSGDALCLCRLGNAKLAVTICEDIWNPDYCAALRKTRLDLIFNISASPFHLGKMFLREKLLSNLADRTQATVIYCNLAGGQDDLVFDGSSLVVASKGRLLAKADDFDEDFLIVDTASSGGRQKKRLVSPQEEAFKALCLGLKDYTAKNGFKRVIVGVSGGIDSAVVMAIACAALGPAAVKGLLMPSAYTSAATLRDAKKICENLGAEYRVVGIAGILKAYLKELRPAFARIGSDKTEENLQARIRGALLMAFSNKFGDLVLNTGNKSEVSCGYCTLYGDMVGGFGLLKDVPKDLVYRLAKYINKIMAGVIPLSVIKRPPTAELAPGQKDSDTLPPYPVLDPILRLYVEEDRSAEEMIKSGFKKATVRRVVKMVDSNEYKRRQAPIGIKITPKAFGRDRRMPITNRFTDDR